MLIPPVNIDAGERRRRTLVRDPPDLTSWILGTEDSVPVGPDGGPGRGWENSVLARELRLEGRPLAYGTSYQEYERLPVLCDCWIPVCQMEQPNDGECRLVIIALCLFIGYRLL